jgi:hypothetical protein
MDMQSTSNSEIGPLIWNQTIALKWTIDMVLYDAYRALSVPFSNEKTGKRYRIAFDHDTASVIIRSASKTIVSLGSMITAQLASLLWAPRQFLL